jgi:hypothetical protein
MLTEMKLGACGGQVTVYLRRLTLPADSVQLVI